MPTFDPKKNFAVSTVAVAPVPALTGLSLQVAAGEGALFPAAGAGVAFNAVVFPANAAPSVANAEIVRVTTRVGEVFTITRAQEGTAARAIQVGDRIMDAITVKSLTDIEAALSTAAGAIVLTAQPVLEPGVAGQVSRGRVLTLADFTTLLGLTAPVGGWNLSDLTDFSGNARNLTNKGAVTFGGGILGAATEAAIFTGSTGQALYIADAGAGDPFRIGYGSVSCWLRTAKRGTNQDAVTKMDAAGSNGWLLGITTANVVRFLINGGTTVVGVTDVCDDRWHHVEATFDGTNTRIYVDGALEVDMSAGIVGPITYAGAYPFNIGGRSADGANPSGNPFFGRIDEAFVTADVLSLDQTRMLYAAKVAHGFGAVPIGAKVSVRRLRKGAALAAGIFSTAPLHLYNFTAGALTDAGSLANALTNTGATVVAPGADGAQGNAFNFVAASSQSLTATDTGLPAGTAARSMGCWFKSVGNGAAAAFLMAYGSGGRFSLNIQGTSLVLVGSDQTNPVSTPASVADGQWHFAVVTADNAAADGLKIKLYLDGKLIATGTALAGTTLNGTFAIGRDSTGSSSFFQGEIDAAFVTGYAMSSDEVAKLYAQGSLSLGVSPKNAGDHVEAMDVTNVYLVADTLDSQNLLDLEVTA